MTTRPARLLLATLVGLRHGVGHPRPGHVRQDQGRQHLVPAADSGRFDLEVGSTTVRTSAGDGGSGSATVLRGTYTVSEAASGTGKSLADYASSIDCRDKGGKGISIGSGTGTSLSGVPVKVGDQIVCTITNVRLGKVEIEKQTDPAESSASFGFGSALVRRSRTPRAVRISMRSGSAAVKLKLTAQAHGRRLTHVKRRTYRVC